MTHVYLSTDPGAVVGNHWYSHWKSKMKMILKRVTPEMLIFLQILHNIEFSVRLVFKFHMPFKVISNLTFQNFKPTIQNWWFKPDISKWKTENVMNPKIDNVIAFIRLKNVFGLSAAAINDVQIWSVTGIIDKSFLSKCKFNERA